ncbi:MAG: hypothetical protein K0R43_1478 [Pseudoduganella sp.]|jgi:hypothetical protein|nr:hypothetical protein [Pseudoduganella sp.]
MEESVKHEVMALSRRIHDMTESAYQTMPATRGDPQWPEKQRVLLADMAMHLVWVSMKPGELDVDKLRSNLYSILTIADQFIPDAELKTTAERLLE